MEAQTDGIYYILFGTTPLFGVLPKKKRRRTGTVILANQHIERGSQKETQFKDDEDTAPNTRKTLEEELKRTEASDSQIP